MLDWVIVINQVYIVKLIANNKQAYKVTVNAYDSIEATVKAEHLFYQQTKLFVTKFIEVAKQALKG